MRIFRSLAEAEGRFAPSAVTIGNFDGVHTAHRELMGRTKSLAVQTGSKPSVVTFHPHPTAIVAPERAPRLLTTPDERCALIEKEQIEQVLILPFDRELSRLAPDQFVDEVLIKALGVRAVVVGDNFRFGHDQAGHVEQLKILGAERGFQVDILPAVRRRARIVSSSEIRRLIRAGAVGMAGRFLGRVFSLDGAVVSGEGRGRVQTVPTLNLATRREVLPAHGVYVTRTHDLDDQRQWDSITNVGVRPTFDGVSLTIETFLLSSFDGRAPHHIRVDFEHYLREERKFESGEALKAQILRDVERAKKWFRRTLACRVVSPEP